MRLTADAEITACFSLAVVCPLAASRYDHAFVA